MDGACGNARTWHREVPDASDMNIVAGLPVACDAEWRVMKKCGPRVLASVRARTAVAQALADVLGAGDAALFAVENLAAPFLQVG